MIGSSALDYARRKYIFSKECMDLEKKYGVEFKDIQVCISDIKGNLRTIQKGNSGIKMIVFNYKPGYEVQTNC